eukprot:GHVS01097214.1.p1 GENE.GHVS01097214.1~~GHVS01097214.1.p1  ORF type:complete len:851 (+),score=77.23 GHVS01097214.1:232-2784(+)
MSSSCCFGTCCIRNLCGCSCLRARWGRKGKFGHRCPSTDEANEYSYDRYPSITGRFMNEDGSSRSSLYQQGNMEKTGEDPREQTESIDLSKEMDEAELICLGRILTEGGRRGQEEDDQTDEGRWRKGGGRSLINAPTFPKGKRNSYPFLGRRDYIEAEESGVQPELEERLALYEMYGEQFAASCPAENSTKADYGANPSEPRLRLMRSALRKKRVTFDEGHQLDLDCEDSAQPDDSFRRATLPNRRKGKSYRRRHVATCAVVLVVTLLQCAAEAMEAFDLFGKPSDSVKRETDAKCYSDEPGICPSPEGCRLCSIGLDPSPLQPPPEDSSEFHKGDLPVHQAADVARLLSSVTHRTTPPPYSTSPSGPFCRSSGSSGVSFESRYSHFLKYYAPFGYLKSVEEVAARELDRFQGQAYLDYTGSGVYQSSQIMNRCADLLSNAYGNAHSRNPSADLTDSRLKEARAVVLRFFNAPAKDFSTVFTSGATGALKMVGESFPWTSSSKFFYLRVNHNSVLGIREYATNNNAEFRALSEQQLEEILTDREHDYKTKGGVLNAEQQLEKPHCLFAFPAKDNFCGKLYPLEWINRVHKVGLSDNCEWRVLLDAAAYAPTHILDMQKWPADYTAISFYKMIGYPTGLGVLLLNNRDATLLNKVYWGGGSVVAATCDTRWCRRKENPSLRFEDGTVSFLAIAGIKYGFDKLFEIGMHEISRHTGALTVYMATELDSLSHLIGSIVVERYGDKEPTGGVVAFNILKPDGEYVNFGQVEMQSSDHGIHLRTGCFCNPGACQDYLGLTVADIIETSSTRESCSDPVSNQRRKALGAVRVSVGYLSTFKDVDRFLQFIRQTYVM